MIKPTMKSQWKIFLNFIPLLLFGSFTSTKCQRIRIPDVTYQDIERLNANCHGLDSCRGPRIYEIQKYNCNCDKTCSLLGTCCVDSKYRKKYKQRNLQNVECRQLNNNRDFYYHWIRSCNPDMQYHKTTEELCLGRATELSDPLVDIPVTDPVTGITYKNYFCFACNERSGEGRLIPWNVAIGGDTEKVNKSSTVPNLVNYKKEFWEWVTDTDNGTALSIWPAIPEELENVLPFCYAFEIVSECASNYSNESVKNKCQAYMALARIFKGTESTQYLGSLPIYKYYRNPHCAICNYESIDDMYCTVETEFPIRAPGGLLPSGDFFVRLFSLQDETNQCRNKQVYDAFAKKCRNIYRARRRVQ